MPRLVHEGVVAAQYVRSWRRQPTDAVLLAPAYTFLMSNSPWSISSGSTWEAAGGGSASTNR